jgi:hypothetical protein
MYIDKNSANPSQAPVNKVYTLNKKELVDDNHRAW